VGDVRAENCRQKFHGSNDKSVVLVYPVARGGWEVPAADTVINTAAIVASMVIVTAYGPVQTHTIELYPTVIR